MDFVATSLIKVRFWIILCPINFVGKARDAIGDMAKELAAQDGAEELAARASDIVIMSKPVRQGVLFECLTQLHAEGSFTTMSSDGMLDAMPRLKLSISQRRRSVRVLLVDDNSTSQQATRRIIMNAGMICDVAGNGKEALAAIERAAPSYHLVLMHLMMPDRATATRFLREKEAEQGLLRLPVIGITATRSDNTACIASGMMDAWIQKPIQEAELLALVDTFIRHSFDGAGTFTRHSFDGYPRDGGVTSVGASGGAARDWPTDESPAAFRVLLAEDSRANQMAISRLLIAQGVIVTVVDYGGAAVVKLVDERAEFDLAFFDINMPIMVGRCRLTPG